MERSVRNRWVVVAALFVALPLLALTGCVDDLMDVELEGPVEHSTVRVSVRNETSGTIWVAVNLATKVEVGATLKIGEYPSTLSMPNGMRTGFSHEGKRAELWYYILRYPEKVGETQDVLIVMTEPEPGSFSADPLPASWVRIRSIGP
jgi:hypothetical protein